MPFLGQTSTQPQQLGAFGLTQAALARLAGRGPGPEVVHLPAQRLLLEAELPGHSGDRATGVDHQLHDFVFVLRSKPPTCASHNEHPLLRGVHVTGSGPSWLWTPEFTPHDGGLALNHRPQLSLTGSVRHLPAVASEGGFGWWTSTSQPARLSARTRLRLAGVSADATREPSRAAGNPTTVGVPTPRQDRDDESSDVAVSNEQPTGAGTFARLIGLVIFGVAAIASAVLLAAASAVGPQVEVAPREGILLGFWSVLYATAAPSARVAVSAVALAALLVSGVALLELRISNRSRRSVDAQSDPLAPKLVRQEPPVSSPAR